MVRTVKIPSDFWKTSESLCLLNPKTPLKEKRMIEQGVNLYKKPGQLWLKSSGTESPSFSLKTKGEETKIKILCLAKSAVLKSARSVNQFYGVTSKDLWLNPIPLFHIGGLAVGARCFLAGAGELVFSPPWNPLRFYKSLRETKTTLTSLVPTQVFDLVNEGLESPPNLRLALVGGGALDIDLYKKALHLDWPLVSVYGMTETCAMIAGTQLCSFQNFPEMKLLDHVKLHRKGDCFIIESPVLFDSWLWLAPDSEPVLEPRPSPFILDDRLEVTGKSLKVLGRSTELVKVLGETVNLANLTRRLGKKLKKNCLVLSRLHPRKGASLVLFIETQKSLWNLEEINKGLLPFEKLDSFYCLTDFPRGATGKILKTHIKFKILV